MKKTITFLDSLKSALDSMVMDHSGCVSYCLYPALTYVENNEKIYTWNVTETETGILNFSVYDKNNNKLYMTDFFPSMVEYSTSILNNLRGL